MKKVNVAIGMGMGEWVEEVSRRMEEGGRKEEEEEGKRKEEERRRDEERRKRKAIEKRRREEEEKEERREKEGMEEGEEWREEGREEGKEERREETGRRLAEFNVLLSSKHYFLSQLNSLIAMLMGLEQCLFQRNYIQTNFVEQNNQNLGLSLENQMALVEKEQRLDQKVLDRVTGWLQVLIDEKMPNYTK